MWLAPSCSRARARSKPLKAGSWHRRLTGLAALVAVFAAAVARSIVTAWRWLRERRSRAGKRVFLFPF